MSKANVKKESKAGTAAPAGGAVKKVSLGADLGIENIRALHGELTTHLEEAGNISLEGSAVERVHAAALQALCLFFRDRRAAGHGTEIQNPSETLRNAAALIGAAPLLNLAKAPV
jgi:ABC-type transporter Mla MlaB component